MEKQIPPTASSWIEILNLWIDLKEIVGITVEPKQGHICKARIVVVYRTGAVLKSEYTEYASKVINSLTKAIDKHLNVEHIGY